MKTFTYPQEIWDAKTCKKKASHWEEDGMGTKYPFKGYIGSSASCPPAYGKCRYNGGTVINNEWYEATERPLPKVDPAYEIIVVPSWGWRIVKKNG